MGAMSSRAPRTRPIRVYARFLDETFVLRFRPANDQVSLRIGLFFGRCIARYVSDMSRVYVLLWASRPPRCASSFGVGIILSFRECLTAGRVSILLPDNTTRGLLP